LALVNRLHQLVGDRCIRFRGDSWLVLHQGPDGPDVAEKIVDAVAAIALRPFPDVGCHNTSGDASRTQPTELSFTVSVGVASEDDFPSAVRHAEVACHRAKVQGKNCVCIAECLQSDVFPG
jgi:GGDEF domain-containing protein